MQDIRLQLKELSYRYKENSYATQADRRKMLLMIGGQLATMGYVQLQLPDFKGRHVNKLIALWQSQGLSTGTMKNRLSTLRWLVTKLQKREIMAPTNDVYGIPKRQYVAEVSKAIIVDRATLETIHDPYVRMSIRLQEAFGLRREEAIKIQPYYADRGSWLVLKSSWCKGGRARCVPIKTQEQRQVLEAAKALVATKEASLIPPNKLYEEQLHRYESQTYRAGLRKLHGLRHAYGHHRFLEESGSPCPVAGGLHRGKMTKQQREEAYATQLIVSAELGHNRPAITKTYLGS